MKFRTACAALLFALATASTSSAEDPRKGDWTVVIPEGGMKVMEFMHSVGAVTGTTITWDSDDKVLLTKKIGATGNLAVPRERLFATLRAHLFRCEIVLLRTTGGTFEAKSMRELMSVLGERLQPDTVDPSETAADGFGDLEGWWITTTVRVSHLEVLEEARAAVLAFLTGNKLGSVSIVPDARSFVVTDFAPNVARVVRTLIDLDGKAATPARSTAHLALRKASAVSVVPVLRELFPDSMPDPAIFPAPRGLRIAADPASNQVVVLGTPGQILQVTAALEGLDKDPVQKLADRPERK